MCNKMKAGPLSLKAAKFSGEAVEDNYCSITVTDSLFQGSVICTFLMRFFLFMCSLCIHLLNESSLVRSWEDAQTPVRKDV